MRKIRKGDDVVVRAGRDWPEDWDNTVIPNVIFRGTP